MEQVTPKTSIEYMKKMGITSLTKTDENLNLALGGLEKGISPLEMATAYACIANDGIYISPTFYTKIENSVGKTVIKESSSKKRVISKEVAFIVKSLLTSPVEDSNGTAKYCKISGIDVAAKTGTTNDEYDRWLCGFTPYYTAVTWFGFDLNETINFNGKNPSGQIWASVMKSIHSDLKNANFEIPKSIETATICPKTGLFAYSNCPNSYTEYFLKGTLPYSYCTEHSGNKITIPTTEDSTSDDYITTNQDNIVLENPINQTSTSTTTEKQQTNFEESNTQESISNTSSLPSTSPATNTSNNNTSINTPETTIPPTPEIPPEFSDNINNTTSVESDNNLDSSNSSQEPNDDIFEQ